MTNQHINIDREMPIEGLPDTHRLVLIEDRTPGSRNFSLVMYLYHKPQLTYIKVINNTGEDSQHIISGEVTRSYVYDDDNNPNLQRTYLTKEGLRALLEIVVKTKPNNLVYTNLEQLRAALSALKKLGLNSEDYEIFEQVLSELEPLHNV